MSQAVEEISTPSARLPSAGPGFPDAALLALGARWRALRDGAPGADTDPATEATLSAEIAAAPVASVAGVAIKLEAALAAGEPGGAAQLRAASEEALSVLRAVSADADPSGRRARLARAVTDFVVGTLAPHALADEPAADEDDPPAKNDGRFLCHDIERDILHRALVGWVSCLGAIQLSMEDSHVPPSALDALLSDMVKWRNKVGAPLPAEIRPQY